MRVEINLAVKLTLRPGCNRCLTAVDKPQTRKPCPSGLS